MKTLVIAPRTPFLVIDQKTLYFTSVKGRWMIALKPICEALGVVWDRQLRTVKASPQLCQLWAQEPIVATDGRCRKMVCLPERYIYGWLLRIDTKNPRVIAFQMKCYDILWDHFNGAGAARLEAIRNVVQADEEQRRLLPKLRANADYQRYMELEGVKLRSGRFIKQQDRGLAQEQRTLFDHTED